MAKESPKKEKRKSIKEIMENIIDKEALEKRKNSSKVNTKVENKPKEEEKSKQWFQLPMEREKFSIHEKNKKFYLRYTEWSKGVYAGVYDKKEECDELIENYIKISSNKNILDRNIPNVHSIIIEEELPLWKTK